MFEQNPMDSGLRVGMARNRMAAQNSILETQNRIEQFRQANRSRQQAQQVMGALSQLDPLNDPEYDRKVMGIIAQAPDATLDRTVANFLDVQGGIFSRAQEQRDIQARDDYFVRKSEAAARAKAAQDQVEYDRQMEASRIKDMNSRFDKLPLPYRQSAAQMAQESGDPETAIASAEIQAQRDAEVNKLRSEGFTDEEIAFDATMPDGTIDPNRAAALVGARKRAKEAEADAPKPGDERAELYKELDQIKQAVQMREDLGGEIDNSDLAARLQEIETKLGWRKAPAAASVNPAAPTGKPDIQSLLTRGKQFQK